MPPDETGNHTAIDNLSINGTVVSGFSFAITEIGYDPDADTITLTWNSRPGEVYSLRFTTDLSNWDADLDDGVPADAGETTTKTIDLSGTSLVDATRAFFRVQVER